MICRTCEQEFDERPSLERRKRLADELDVDDEARTILSRPSPRCDDCDARDLLEDIDPKAFDPLIDHLAEKVRRRLVADGLLPEQSPDPDDRRDRR